MPTTYISIDIETDGPCPGINSLLALGAVAFDELGVELGSFYCNFLPMAGLEEDHGTMQFWKENPEAFAATRTNQMSSKDGITGFVRWLNSMPHQKTFMAYPSGFDFTWVYWYCCKFLGRSPVGFSCLDLKSLAFAILETPFNRTTKRKMPKEWFSDHKHSHIAVEDARDQGEMFFRMMEDLRWKKSEQVERNENDLNV